MTSYPKTVDKFIPWTKAMVAGATVGKPNYGKMKSSRTSRPLAKVSRKRRLRKRNRRKRAKKEG